MRPDRAQRLLSRQYGVITVQQALSSGLTRNDIRVLVETGAWRRLARGLFVLGGSPPSFEQKALTACLMAGPGAVASHKTAARLLGVAAGLGPAPRLEITVPTRNSALRARQLGAKVHRSRQLDKQDRVIIGRIPVTHPARVLVDLANELSTRKLEHLVDDVLCRYPATSPQSVLDRIGKRPGGPALRQALAPWLTGPRPQSPPEMELFRRLDDTTERGRLERQYRITDPETAEFLGRVDLAYPDAKVAIEYNGRRHHNPRTAEHDQRRKEGIEMVGWTVEDTGQR